MNLDLLPGLLLPWFEAHKRDLPWRADKEPYHVWVSEIMLQQTRVEAVKGYYLRFLAALPDIQSLASCDDDRLHKLWEGLGYYSRVKNLKRAAQVICEKYNGVFPRSYAEVLSLPGIGPYTAGAICSISFGMPTPAVDGNVLRVLTRLMALRTSVSKPETKTELERRLQKVYPADACGDFTQAIMELGATVCLPNGAPCCEECPLSAHCLSREGALWREIPVKDEKAARRKESKTVFILRCENRTAILKRGDTGLLAGLWELPNTDTALAPQAAMDYAASFGCSPCSLNRSVEKKHIFTHIEWTMTGYDISCRCCSPEFIWATEEELTSRYSLPTAFRQFLEDLLK